MNFSAKSSNDHSNLREVISSHMSSNDTISIQPRTDNLWAAAAVVEYLAAGQPLMVQRHAEAATVNCQPVVVAVIDKAQLPELIHEMADPRASGANHLG